MIRKTVLAIAAVAALGAAALAPTAASAGPFGFHHHHHFHGPHFGIGYWGGDWVGDDCYLVKKMTRYGYKYVQVCN
jgi:Spy/CpxP family protein refolding chaperone